MPYEALKKKFPEEGSRCLKSCGKCCTSLAPMNKREAIEVAEWIVANKSLEELTAQFNHFDDQPDRCPLLTPEKTCFVYPVRPVVCVMFGHLPDAPNMPKQWSQQCPEGVQFTQLKPEEYLDESVPWFVETGKDQVRTIIFRGLSVTPESGPSGMIPVKPGSAFEKLKKAEACTKCGKPFKEKEKAYLEGKELLCQGCEDAMKPGG